MGVCSCGSASALPDASVVHAELSDRITRTGHFAVGHTLEAHTNAILFLFNIGTCCSHTRRRRAGLQPAADIDIGLVTVGRLQHDDDGTYNGLADSPAVCFRAARGGGRRRNLLVMALR